CLQDFSLPWTF
nr:immunoglobulin light chain junction region [Macaca mulatta]MOV63461.1 immunoglobulin light chain junction region [Macaca mulatta]MOV63466.1 immunoglobulin light chain junction region [Macaca mulatta]